jgi:hypothetical protein
MRRLWQPRSHSPFDCRHDDQRRSLHARLEVLTGRDKVTVAKAHQTVSQALPVIVGLVLGCAIGAATQTASRHWSLGLLAALALLAVVMQRRSE